jgi:hypothetical protein
MQRKWVILAVLGLAALSANTASAQDADREWGPDEKSPSPTPDASPQGHVPTAAPAPIPASPMNPPAGPARPPTPPPGGFSPMSPQPTVELADAAEPPAPPPAQPAPPSYRFDRGVHLALSAEKLFGYHHWSYASTVSKLDGQPPPVGIDAASSGDQVAVLTGGSFTGSGTVAINPHAVPRLGVDLAVVQGITLGAAVTYYSAGGDLDITEGFVELHRKNARISVFGGTARLGYAHLFTDAFGMWARLGFTYGTQSVTFWSYPTPGSNPTENQLSIRHSSFDPELVAMLMPAKNFGLLVGLSAALGLGGGYEYRTGGATVEEGTGSLSDMGVTAGLMGWL